jgi:RNA-dependent RNA polymerase
VFLRWTQKGTNHIQVGGRRLRFDCVAEAPPWVLADILEKTPFLDPDIEERRERKKRELDGVPPLPVDQIQIGTFYRVSPGALRDFSVEWEYPNPLAKL